MSLTRVRSASKPLRAGVRAGVVVMLVALNVVAWSADAAEQQTFASPDDAAAALIGALKTDDVTALRRIFGPGGEALVSSGDQVADAAARKEFVEWAGQSTRIDREGDARAELVVGPDAWPFPVPLVKSGDKWRFDTAAGKNEILNRRIGRNELRAIATARAFVEAQADYAHENRDGKGAGVFAARFLSTPGHRDGLYWATGDAEPSSPLGPLVADAAKEGYRRKGNQPIPFHGYYFRILTAQGPHAPGGAKSYLKNGRLTGGFAMVAYPASYGASGIMTFIVNQQGVVFQKNLGAKTAALASSMTRYDPDRSWTPVTE